MGERHPVPDHHTINKVLTKERWPLANALLFSQERLILGNLTVLLQSIKILGGHSVANSAIRLVSMDMGGPYRGVVKTKLSMLKLLQTASM